MPSHTTPRFVRAAAAQLAPARGDLATSRSRAAAAIVEAAARGASVVVLPGLCVSGYAFADAEEARASAPHTPVQIEVTVAAATAVVNRVFVVQADRSGRERGIEFEAASVIVDPDGRIVAGPEPGVALLVADLELERARSNSIGPRNDVFADRRPELYGGGVSSMGTITQELR